MYTPVFYDKRMNVEGLDSYSPSAGKPARFCSLLEHYDYRSYAPQHLGRVTPVTKDDLCRVHSRYHVEAIWSGRLDNGFGNTDPRVPESRLWTIGSLLSASRRAMKYPATPVCSPSSGYHHACWAESSGFCTFNGLMVVAAILQSENPAFRLAILDVDQHEGNGTSDIMKHRPDINVLHFTSGQYFCGDSPDEALDFQVWLHSAIGEINAYQPDLVLYNAGADSHIDDPLGGYLTTEQMAKRDRDVFCGIRAPIAWCLAGGYQKSKDGTIFTDPVLQLHRNTLIESDRSLTVRKQWWPENDNE